MEYPIKVFEIKGFSDERISMEITEVYGFPEETSFRGGYDVQCSLQISCGVYNMRTDCYYTSTGALFDFYNELSKCHKDLQGTASYKVYCPENDFELDIEFNARGVKIRGKYQDVPTVKNVLSFEFESDQSYFNEVIADLKRVALQFVGKQGKNRKR